MNNIGYFGIPYCDDADIRDYRLSARKRAKHLRERYNKNKELIASIEEVLELEQQDAIAAYQKMRTERKLNRNKDAVLVHLDMRR